MPKAKTTTVARVNRVISQIYDPPSDSPTFRRVLELVDELEFQFKALEAKYQLSQRELKRAKAKFRDGR